MKKLNWVKEKLPVTFLDLKIKLPEDCLTIKYFDLALFMDQVFESYE